MMKMTEQNRKYLEERLTFWDEITKEEQEILIQNTSVVRYTQGQNMYDARRVYYIKCITLYFFLSHYFLSL